jgi:hypothetical protein
MQTPVIHFTNENQTIEAILAFIAKKEQRLVELNQLMKAIAKEAQIISEEIKEKTQQLM